MTPQTLHPTPFLHCHGQIQDGLAAPGVLMQVADTGAGLSPEVRAKLFRPFFTTRPDGNGLGLWISVGLVERYGGSIEGASRRDAGEDRPGAVFSIHLRQDGVSEGDSGSS